MARLVYGIEYNAFDDDEITRPSKIHFHFQLYENGQLVGQLVEGVFENVNPWFKRFKMKFEFVPYIKAELTTD